MKFKLVCPNGQWVAGKPASVEAMSRLSGIGFKFETVQRHGVEFTRTVGEVDVSLETLDELMELQDVANMKMSLDGTGVIVFDDN